MKTLLFSILSLVIGFLCYAFYAHWLSTNKTVTALSEVSLTPTTAPFTILIPPSKSLKGSIERLSGNVNWESRISTEEAHLDRTQLIQQGEVIKTDDGTVDMLFSNTSNVKLQEKTELSIIQTLPEHMVFEQAKGTATYIRLGKSPVTIRTGRLLIDLQKDTEVTVIVDEEEVIITAENGEVELGYNDTDLVSRRVMIKEGDEATFDIETRTILF